MTLDDGYQGDYDGDFNRAIETANRLSEIDMLYIDDTPGIISGSNRQRKPSNQAKKGCVGMILVDYLTLMTAERLIATTLQLRHDHQRTEEPCQRA